MLTTQSKANKYPSTLKNQDSFIHKHTQMSQVINSWWKLFFSLLRYSFTDNSRLSIIESLILLD